MDAEIAPAGPARSSRARAAGLLWALARADFQTRHRGTALGFLWALLKPGAFFAVLLVVFSFAFPSGPGYALRLMVGFALWELFAEGTRAGLVSLQAKGWLLTRGRFPGWIVVAASLWNALVTFGVFAVAILIALASTRRATGGGVLVFLAATAGLVVVVLGFALGASVLFVRSRDLGPFWDVGLHAGFFLAPVVYPLALVPEPVRGWLALWPPTTAIEVSRAALLGGPVALPYAPQLLALQAGVALGLGIAVFRRGIRRAAEYL